MQKPGAYAVSFGLTSVAVRCLSGLCFIPPTRPELASHKRTSGMFTPYGSSENVTLRSRVFLPPPLTQIVNYYP